MKNHIGNAITETFNKFSEKVMLRSYVNETWENYTGEQANKLIRVIAENLLLENVQHQEKVGIFAQNMPKWTMADIASTLIGAVPVPIYATNIASQVKYILKDANIRVLFIGEEQQYKEVLQIIDDQDTPLQRIIIFDESIKINHPKAIYFKDWIKNDTKEVKELFLSRNEEVKPYDLATIIYTSGTTGEPKGVILDHDNILETIANHEIKFNLSSDDSSLAFLPLSHVFERLWTYYILYKGMQNTYCKDPKNVANLLPIVQPTVLCSVPRLYEKIYQMAMSNVEKASKTKQKLFNWAIETGKKVEKNRLNNKANGWLLQIQYSIADKLVLSKIREKMGGKLRFMPCGGAFLSAEITFFFRAVGLPIVIGYGLTETTATVTAYGTENYFLGSVGKVLPNVEVKIGEENEILVKGANVMRGYYNKPEETENVFDKDGWFRTGDAGHLDDEGNLFITDRIKDLIKTSGGKYIAPQLVEAVLSNHGFIEQVAVMGEGKPYASALLTPNFEELKLWAEEKKIIFKDIKELISKPEVIKKYNEIVNKLQTSLAQFEKIKKFTLMPEEFSIEANEVTPTFKLKRKIIAVKYHALIEQMYNS